MEIIDLVKAKNIKKQNNNPKHANIPIGDKTLTGISKKTR